MRIGGFPIMTPSDFSEQIWKPRPGSGDSVLRVPLRARGFTLIELLIVIAIIGVLVGLLLPAVQAAREASRRSSCGNNLHQLAIAIQKYENDHRSFPAGAYLHKAEFRVSISWRVMILPQLEETSLYAEINPDSDGGATSDAARSEALPVYLCPSAPPPDPNEYVESNYSGVAGAGRDGNRRTFADPVCGDIYTDGMFYPGSATRIADITDGTSHTLAIGERNYTFRDWMSGAAWFGHPAIKQICTGATNNFVYPLNARGYYVKDSDAPEELRTMRLNELYFGSDHPGGAQFCLADGSVKMISEGVNLNVLQDMSTIAGEEVSRLEP
jgi:prepilin-type N-terminal cleavage/methylation domain-containing protein/prepilin-type processing-associated H-X9-DG protein